MSIDINRINLFEERILEEPKRSPNPTLAPVKAHSRRQGAASCLEGFLVRVNQRLERTSRRREAKLEAMGVGLRKERRRMTVPFECCERLLVYPDF